MFEGHGARIHHPGRTPCTRPRLPQELGPASAIRAATWATDHDRQDLAAKPAGARSVAPVSSRLADAARVPARRRGRVHGLLPRTYTNPVTISGPDLLHVGHLLLRGHPAHHGRRQRGRRLAAVSSKAARPISTRPSTPPTRRRRTTSTVSGRRSCSASPAVSSSRTTSADRSTCSSTSGTWRPATPARRRRPMCPSCP